MLKAIATIGASVSDVREVVHNMKESITADMTKSMSAMDTSLKGVTQDIQELKSKQKKLDKSKPRHTSQICPPISSSEDEMSDNGVISFSSNSNIRSSRVRSNHVNNIKVPAFTGKECWNVWFTRFQTIGDRANWSDNRRLDEMLPKLLGDAGDFVFSQLSAETRNSFNKLTTELHYRFRVIENTRAFQSQFSRRDQKATESIEEYVAELKRLYNKAHPNRDHQTREEDLLRRFLDGLAHEQARFQVEYIKNPQNIDQAAYEVVNFLETKSTWSGQSTDRRKQPTRMVRPADEDDDIYDDPDQINRVAKHGVVTSTAHAPGTMHNQMYDRPRLPKHISNNDHNNRSRQETRSCYNCGIIGHLARDCPTSRLSRQYPQHQTKAINNFAYGMHNFNQAPQWTAPDLQRNNGNQARQMHSVTTPVSTYQRAPLQQSSVSSPAVSTHNRVPLN